MSGTKNQQRGVVGIFLAAVFVIGSGCEGSAGGVDFNSKSWALSPAFSDGSYELYEADEFDPLWRFHKGGGAVRLESDPSVTSWGSDYWGYWSDPFDLVDNAISYVAGGLTTSTYEFVPLPDGLVDVTKTVVVQPYLGGSPTTTVKHLGSYQPIGGSDTGQDDSEGDTENDTGTEAPEPTCDDTVENGNESDVDCGGPDCPGCEDGRACVEDFDCLSESCAEGICVTEAAGHIVAEVALNSNWGRGYCASIRITNESDAPTTSWSVVLDTNGGTVWSRWNAVFSGRNGEITVTPAVWNAAIGAGQTLSRPGFCASSAGGGTAEVISATAQY